MTSGCAPGSRQCRRLPSLTAIGGGPDNGRTPDLYVCHTVVFLPRTRPVLLATLVAALLSGMAPQIRADADHDAIYDEAVAAFESGRDVEALAGFHRLQAAGDDDPAIDFNLGAIHYRMAAYEQAITAFGRAARDPRLAALAAYNAALSAWRLEDRRRTAHWLARAQAASPGTALQELIRELERTMAPEDHAPRPGGLVSLATGYDSNVTLRANDETLPESGTGDTWLELYGDFDYAPRLLARAGLSLHGSAWLLKYQDMHVYDSALFRLNVRHGRDLGPWRIETDLSIERTRADGSGLTSGHTLRFDASRSPRPRHRLRLAAEAGWVRESHARFAYLAGSHRAFELESAWRIGSARTRAIYRYEYNDRNDLREPFFTSVSPRRHELGGDVRFRLDDRTTVDTGLRYRHGRYADPSELPDGTAIRRKDDRIRIFLRLNRSLARDRELTLQFERTVNHSNISAYDYRQSGISVGLRLPW